MHPIYRAMQGSPTAIKIASAWQAQGLDADLVERREAHSDDVFSQLYAPTKRKTFLLDLAWDCVETIATLRSHRIPEPQEAWRDVSRSESRLLCQIDAILSCGREIVLSIGEMVFDPDLSDPDRVYAVLMVIGCVDEETWIGKAIDILQRAALNDPQERLAAIEAMCLIPHPRVREFLAPLLEHSEPNVRAAALEILAYRYQLGCKDVMKVMNDTSLQVVTQVAGNLDKLETSEAGEVYERLLTHSEEQVVRSAFSIGVWRPSPRAKRRMHELCMAERGSFAEAIVFLALLGEEGDLGIIRSLLGDKKNHLTLRAAGYFGHPDLIPVLIDVLRNAQEEIGNETAVALNRITGANLTKAVEMSDYDPEDQEFLDQPPGQEVLLLSTEYVAWSSWYTENKRTLIPNTRLRRGKQFGSSILLEELEVWISERAEREVTHIELRKMAGGRCPQFHPLDFVAVQEASLKELKKWEKEGRFSQLERGWFPPTVSNV